MTDIAATATATPAPAAPRGWSLAWRIARRELRGGLNVNNPLKVQHRLTGDHDLVAF